MILYHVKLFVKFKQTLLKDLSRLLRNELFDYSYNLSLKIYSLNFKITSTKN